MHSATIDTIKTELKQLPPREVLDLLLRLARFKKENKELLTYILFESANVEQVKKEIAGEMLEIDGLPAYQYKKQFRKIQRKINKPIKYIGNKSATAELYLHMVRMISEKKKTISLATFLDKILQQYIIKIEKLLPGIEDDLAADMRKQLKQIF
jgi:DNA repair protein RadC